MLNEDLGFSGDIKRLKASAEAGDAEAQFQLGVLYEKGRGAERDWAQAFRWCREAAEQGHAEAQFKLGVLYEKGRGAERDRDQSVYWQRKAAELGHTDAQNKLSECYYNGTGVEQDLTQALYWHGKAAEQGHTDAQDKPSERCGESAPKGKRGRGEDEPLGPFQSILVIAVTVFGAVIPFVMPEAVDLTPVCQFIMAYLYVFVALIEAVFGRISKRSKSVMILLYSLSWAASITFGFLVLGALSGFWMILSPIMFWGVIGSIRYFKNQWEAGMP